MAAPNILSTAGTTPGGLPTSYNVPYGTTAPGDLLCILSTAKAGATTISYPAGDLTDNLLYAGSASTHYVAATYLICDGTETGSFTVSHASAQNGGTVVIRIAAGDWHGTTPPEAVYTNIPTASDDWEAESMTISGWDPSTDANDTLMIGNLICGGGFTTISAWPTELVNDQISGFWTPTFDSGIVTIGSADVSSTSLSTSLVEGAKSSTTGGSTGLLAVRGVVAAGPDPSITDAGDELYKVGDTVSITGANFEAAQGTGSVVISPTDNIADVNAETQTINSWAAGTISIDVVRGSLAFGTQMYLFVENDTGNSNPSGYSVQFEPLVTVDETLQDEAGSLVVSETAIKASVWRNREPTGAPDQELTGLTTNGSGAISFEIANTGLSDGDPIYLLLFKDDAVNWQATAVKLVPTYS